MKIRTFFTVIFSLFSFSQLIHAQTDDKPSLTQMAEIAYDNRRYDDAITYALQALEDENDNFVAIWVCGAAYRKIGFYSEALRYDKKMLCLNNSGVHFNIALVYSDLGYDSLAIQYFNYVIEADPNDAAAFNGVGVAYSRRYQFDEAKASFERAMEIDGDDNVRSSFPYFNLGLLYYQSNDKEKALWCLNKSLELEPDDAITMLSIEQVKGEQNEKYKPSKAILKAVLNSYNKTCRENRYSSYSFFKRGECHDLLGNKELAKRDYEEALRLYSDMIDDVPDSSKFLSFRGLCYGKLDKKEEALKDYYRALELDPAQKWVQDEIDKLMK